MNKLALVLRQKSGHAAGTEGMGGSWDGYASGMQYEKSMLGEKRIDEIQLVLVLSQKLGRSCRNLVGEEMGS